MSPDGEREERDRLERLARYQPTITSLMGDPLEILDAESFLQMHQEIIEQAIYFFAAQDDRPTIIDGGANIGISVVFFKQLFPRARIIAFEPDDAAFAALTRNVARRGYEDVKLVRAALAATTADLPFMNEGSYAGRIARGDDPATTTVAGVRLRPYLEQRVDLLKLNIEGAETAVLDDCRDLLGNVDRIVVEYHSFAGERQTLHTLLGVLAGAGFRLYVRSVNEHWALQPFVSRPVHMAMDLQLYVYASRDG